MTYRTLAAATLIWISACSPASEEAAGDSADAATSPEMVTDDASPSEASGAVTPDANSGSAESDSSVVNELRAFIAEQPIDKSQSGWKEHLPKPPMAEFTDGEEYFWLLDTNQGPIKARLFPDSAPMHVSSTIYLTEFGFYDELTFHRVIPEFMAQGGCPSGSGRGNPGYRYDGEFGGDQRHDRPGLLSMANAGPGTDGSQFFLTFVPTPHLDGNHTIFGEVVEGMDTLKAIEALGTPPRGETKEPVVIRTAKIVVE